MSQAELYNILSIVFFALSVAMLIISVILFFKLKIPQVVGYLTGKTAAKKIREIERRSSEDSEHTSSRRMTAKISKASLSSFEIPHNKDNENQNLTEVLEENPMHSEDTTVLSQTSSETVVLDENLVYNKDIEPKLTSKGVDFEIETDILLIHTDEIIA